MAIIESISEPHIQDHQDYPPEDELDAVPLEIRADVADTFSASPEEVAEANFIASAVRKALKRLPERELTILLMRNGFFGEPETFASIGQKFGRSGARIRQLEGQAIARLYSSGEVVSLFKTSAEEGSKDSALWKAKAEIIKAEARIENETEGLPRLEKEFPALVNDSLKTIGVVKIQKMIAEHRVSYILSQKDGEVDYGAEPRFEMRSTIIRSITNGLGCPLPNDDRVLLVLEKLVHDVSRTINIPLRDSDELRSWLAGLINRNVAEVLADKNYG